MTRISRICLVAGLIAGWFTFVLTYGGVLRPPFAASTNSIPPDVLARSDVARSHMRQIAGALGAYAMENHDLFPPDLSMLYPRYVSDPRVFWHPGDSDPQPATIDNNTLNQPNSTRISFEFAPSASPSMGMDDPLIWDNSAANNGGLFATTLTIGGQFKTSPAWITPTPTRREVAQRYLWSLSSSCLDYAEVNKGIFPSDLTKLVPHYIDSPSAFWNPGDSDPEPTAITNSVPNAPNSTQISYAYLAGYNNTMSCVLLLDNSFANNEGGSDILVGYSDGTGQFYQKSSRCRDLSLVARQHLQQIGTALRVYAADNMDQFPPLLSMLYPSYISDPAVFWNPGQTGWCPTTINNDLPRKGNSAQVSFRYLGADYTANCDPRVILAVDYSRTNNSGTGINILTADGAVDSYGPPPLSCQHPPTCSARAAANLKKIGTALEMYASIYRGYLPPKLSILYPYCTGPDPILFWNPGDSDVSPVTIDNDVPNQPNSAQISFEYLGPGGRWGGDPSEIVVRDNSPANNAGRGINVLYYDGRTEYIASVTPTSLTVAGPANLPLGGFAHYTCSAIYSDGSTWDLTPYVTWSVTSGPGGVSDQGTFVAPLSVAQSAPATIHVSYTEGGVTREADHVVAFGPCHDPFADADGDGDVDAADFAVFQRCLGPNGGTSSEACGCFDRPVPPAVQGDGDVDQDDLLAFIACASGPAIPAANTCDD